MGSGEDSPDPSFFTILIVTRMTMRRTVLTICVTSLFLLAPTARSWRDNRSSTQIPRTPLACTDNAHRQFDFWVGNWDVFDVERPTVVVAHARVELILNACVLHEVYESVDGHKGESFSIYYDPSGRGPLARRHTADSTRRMALRRPWRSRGGGAIHRWRRDLVALVRYFISAAQADCLAIRAIDTRPDLASLQT
jgi:hypothetical protein